MNQRFLRDIHLIHAFVFCGRFCFLADVIQLIGSTRFMTNHPSMRTKEGESFIFNVSDESISRFFNQNLVRKFAQQV